MPADHRLDLNLFRVLDAIYVHGGISAAARALHLTQPAVTHALNRLRAHFDDPLFVRQGNRVVPTERTRSVIADVQRHLNGLQGAARAQAAFDPATLDLNVTVGCRDVLESIALPALVAALAHEAPGLRLVSRRVPIQEIGRGLESGALDLVIGNWPKPDPRFARDDLFSDTVVCLMRDSHPLAQATLTRDAYAAAAHLAPTPYTGDKRNAIEIGLARAGLTRRIVTTLPYFGLVPQVLLQSDLIFTTTRRFATHYAQLLPLVVVAPPVPFPRIRSYLLTHPQPDRPTDIAWLRALMQSVSGELTAARGARRR